TFCRRGNRKYNWYVSADELFREFEHTGDAGIEVVAPSRGELLRRAVLGLASLMVGGEIRQTERRRIEVRSDSDEDMLHDFLAAALNLFLLDGFIWSDAEVVERSDGLAGELRGETL